MMVRMMKDGRVRRVHYQYTAIGGLAWMYAPFKKERQYAASPEGARDNLVRRMEREGWVRLDD